MTPEEAQAVLLDKHYVPAFVEKCAELGVNFSGQEQLLTALTTAAQVKLMKQAEEEQGSTIDKAAHDMNVALFGENYRELLKSGGESEAEVDTETKDALAALAAASAE